MYTPARDDELTGLTNYADQQLGALRAALYGLTEEQARSTPCRSSLSVGGIVKHVEQGMAGAIDRLRNGAEPPALDEAGVAAYLDGLVLGADESAAELVERFDRTRAEFLEVLAQTDPDSDAEAPPAPWSGIYESTPIKNRYYLVHQIEEFARHAGHADIIREQIDGQSVPGLEMSMAGAPANQFFTPFVPEPGTLLT